MSIYQTEEWKGLEKISRAQLLLVIEGLKRGAIIDGNWTFFTDILRKTGLNYALNTSKYWLEPVIVVAKPEDLLEWGRKYLTLPEGANYADFHKIEGWLLGYPECCIEEYVKERTPEQEYALKNGQRHMGYKFGQELTAKIESEESYPCIFDYLPPTFTPCSVNCQEAIKLLITWKNAIEMLDPEAAGEMVYFNRSGFPERLVHKDYLFEEHKHRRLQSGLEFLKRSVT